MRVDQHAYPARCRDAPRRLQALRLRQGPLHVRLRGLHPHQARDDEPQLRVRYPPYPPAGTEEVPGGCLAPAWERPGVQSSRPANVTGALTGVDAEIKVRLLRMRAVGRGHGEAWQRGQRATSVDPAGRLRELYRHGDRVVRLLF